MWEGNGFEAVIKLRMYFGMGLKSHPITTEFVKDAFSGPLTDTKYFDDFNVGMGGSVGLLVHKKVLLSIFANLDCDESVGEETKSMEYYEALNYMGGADGVNKISINTFEKTLGIELMYMPEDWLQLSIVGQKELFDTRVKMDVVPTGKANVISKSFNGTTGLFNVKLNW